MPRIFPAVATITARLNAVELNYPEGQRFKWSRPTVFRYLDRLKRGGVATSGGLSHYHGTRRRVLHSDRLLSVPLESETPTPANLRQELNPRSLKFHGNAHAETPAAAQTAARCARGVSGMELRQPARATELLNAIYNRYPQHNYLWSAEMLAWALRNPDRRISDPLKYAITCVDNFVGAYPDYQQKAILKRFCDDLPDVYFDGQQWRGPSEQDRKKIGFIHMIVEEAAHRGVQASEVLAQRLESG